MDTPLIGRPLAIALCNDPYTSMPALDCYLWQGASEHARCAYFETWAFCYDPNTGRIEAQDEDGNGAYSLVRSAWEAL